ncbi:FAD-dependent oxidoreductase [Rhodoferax ferrireducens]|uniref:FAD-dependent oxidoreductase n=1 Tax=Rhodoferax ferrireducens TaxID=192843 RepID=UPI002FCDCF43
MPTIFLNGEVFGSGRMEIEEIIGKLDSGAAARDAARLSARAPYDVLIVGGGPAGAAAAVYAARKGIRTGLAARSMTRWASRTSSRWWRPTVPNSPPRSKPMSAPTTSTS